MSFEQNSLKTVKEAGSTTVNCSKVIYSVFESFEDNAA